MYVEKITITAVLTSFIDDTIGNITALVFAVSVLFLTVIKTLQAAQEYRKLHLINKPGLANLLLLNGECFYVYLKMVSWLWLAGAVYFLFVSSLISWISTDFTRRSISVLNMLSVVLYFVSILIFHMSEHFSEAYQFYCSVYLSVNSVYACSLIYNIW